MFATRSSYKYDCFLVEISTFQSDLINYRLPHKHCWGAVFVFWPIYQLGHPEDHLRLLLETRFTGSKHPKIIRFHVENNINAGEACAANWTSKRNALDCAWQVCAL